MLAITELNGVKLAFFVSEFTLLGCFKVAHFAPIDPIGDTLSQNRECVRADEQLATLCHSSHASQLLVRLDDLSMFLVFVVAPATDLAIVGARHQQTTIV